MKLLWCGTAVLRLHYVQPFWPKYVLLFVILFFYFYILWRNHLSQFECSSGGTGQNNILLYISFSVSSASWPHWLLLRFDYHFLLFVCFVECGLIKPLTVHLAVMSVHVRPFGVLTSLLGSFLPVDNIWAMVTLWQIRGNIIRTVLFLCTITWAVFAVDC